MADDDEDTAEETRHLAEVANRLRAHRLELARTVRALRMKRRTPEQIREVIDRAKRVVYRSMLTRRKLEQARRVH